MKAKNFLHSDETIQSWGVALSNNFHGICWEAGSTKGDGAWLKAYDRSCRYSSLKCNFKFQADESSYRIASNFGDISNLHP